MRYRSGRVESLQGGDSVATSTFDRPLVLTERGVDNLIALKKKWEKNPLPPVKPMPDDFMKVTDALLKKCLFPSDC